MDAVSLALGVRSAYLRSNDKTDFIYRRRRRHTVPNEPLGNVEDDEADRVSSATKSWVAVEFVDGGKTRHFK